MPNELDFRITLLALYGLFHAVRIAFGVKVLRSGGKIFSRKDDDAHEGRVHSAAGMFAELVMPLSIVLYAIYPGWVARLSLPLPDGLRIVAAFLSVAFIVYLFRVHRALGRHWAVSLILRQGHTLVTTGPYARVRHPMYTALIGNMICLSVVSANLVVVLPRALQILLILLRVGKEEAMLLARFGDEYRDYAGRTGRLLPPLSR